MYFQWGKERSKKISTFTEVRCKTTPSLTFIQHETWISSGNVTVRQTTGTTKTSPFCVWQEDSQRLSCARANLPSPAFFTVWLDRKLVQNRQWQPQRGWASRQLCSHDCIPWRCRALCTVLLKDRPLVRHCLWTLCQNPSEKTSDLDFEERISGQ